MRYFIALLLFSSTLLAAPTNHHRENLLNLVAGDWIAQSLYTAAKFDIATHLSDGSKSVGELAELTDTNEENLYRLLRLLASHGIFQEEENRIFSNSSSSALLSSNHLNSLRSLILFYSSEMSESMRRLPECITKGKPAFDLTYGQSVFPYFRDHPKSAEKFNEGMQEKSKAVIASAIDSYDFSKFQTLYDIGGGNGNFLTTLLEKNPKQRGLLFEVPEVVNKVKKTLNTYGRRCAIVAGDFFKSVPKDGEAYLLKSILHDSSDKDALKILVNCHEAMPAKSKLLILEPLLREGKNYAKSMDILTMAITGGGERTQADFERLLSRAGFKIDSITSTETEFSIIEATKVL